MNVKNLRVKAQAGFTLIELMIVVAIVGILAAVAIPQYSDYVTRAKWTDNLTSIASLKLAVAECAQDKAGDPSLCEWAAAGDELEKYGITALPAPTNSSVAITAGVITVTGTNDLAADGCVFDFTPTNEVGAGRMSWDVTATGANAANCIKYVKGSHV